MKKMSIIALLSLVGAVSSAQAQQKSSGKASASAPAAASGEAQSGGGAKAGGDENVQYKAKTVYDFEDDMVEGDLQRPDGELIDSVRGPKHSSLIEIRKDFIPEMLKSLEDV